MNRFRTSENKFYTCKKKKKLQAFTGSHVSLFLLLLFGVVKVGLCSKVTQKRMTSARVFLSVGSGGWGRVDNLDDVRYECIALSLGCSGEVPECFSAASSGGGHGVAFGVVHEDRCTVGMVSLRHRDEQEAGKALEEAISLSL